MNAVVFLIAYAFAAHNNVGYVVIVVSETRSKMHKLIVFGSGRPTSLGTLTFIRRYHLRRILLLEKE